MANAYFCFSCFPVATSGIHAVSAVGIFCGPSSLPVFLPPSVQPVMFLLRQLLRDGRAPHACFVLYKALSLYLLALASGKNFFLLVGAGEEL